MDPEPPVSSLCVFKETRVSLEPSNSGYIIQIQVPSTSTFSVRPRQQRRILKTPPTYQDESSFGRQYLTNTASFFFGRSKTHPRSFLWRVLQEGKVLEVQSVDISYFQDVDKPRQEPRQASLIIQLCFPSVIKEGGVGIADNDDHDALNVFVLTKGNELYTLTLRKDLFSHTAASEEGISRLCKVYKPATFSISTPHRLAVANALRLVISLSDGRLLLLTRQKNDEGSKWYESTYGDGQWTSSLRGLIRWQGNNTVKHDGVTLEQGTPIAMEVSPDKKHIFAVCMNHTLRIWNPDKAASVFSKDLLWQHHELHETPKWMLDPASPNVLQIFQSDTAVEGDLYYAVTFSPHDLGQFKFWGIRDPDSGDKGVRDLYPDCPLKPPDPDPSPESKAIWKVVDFKVKGGEKGKGLEMWVLMRSNRHHKLYNLRFDILDLAVVWQDQWSTMASEVQDQGFEPQVSDLEPVDATDKWLDFILLPGKYPNSVLETALGMYVSEHSLKIPNSKASLRERMCAAISLSIQKESTGNDLEKHRKITDQEWTSLWQDIRDLDKSRWDVLSLAYDAQAEMPWIAFAGGCSAIRTCDQIERIVQNKPTVLAKSMGMLETPSIELDSTNEPRLPDELAVIIQAAAQFGQGFSYGLKQRCCTILAEELWLEPSHSVPLRIQSFYDRCNFEEEISDAPFTQLTKALKPVGGFDGLETGAFLDILAEFAHELPPDPSGLLYTAFGRKVLINGAKEMIILRERILFNLLMLIVFVDTEIDRDAMPMESFDAPQIYDAMLDLIRQYQISHWLIKNIREDEREGPGRGRSSTSDVPNVDKTSDGQASSTVLESIFVPGLPPQSYSTQSQSEALSSGIRDLLQFIIGGHASMPLNALPVHVQANLLAHNNIVLATDFLRYQPSTAWSTYIKGRLYLARGENTEAGIYFKKAAYKLSCPSDFDYEGASQGLLTNDECVSFGNGLPTYYTHILNLFDSASCPTQMAHFAHLALQLLPMSETPSNQTAPLLSSLMQASLQTTDFPTAFTALTRHPKPETHLPSFINALLSNPNALPQLLSLPFPPSLHSQIDSLLSAPKASPKILSAWRLHHNDFRGAAAALLPPLQASQAKVKRSANGLEDDYLTVINLLACAGKENGWVLSHDVDGKGVKGKRKVVTIQDVRAGYQRELDRRSVIESGRFAFGGGGGGGGGGGRDEEDEEEMDML